MDKYLFIVNGPDGPATHHVQKRVAVEPNIDPNMHFNICKIYHSISLSSI